MSTEGKSTQFPYGTVFIIHLFHSEIPTSLRFRTLSITMITAKHQLVLTASELNNLPPPRTTTTSLRQNNASDVYLTYEEVYKKFRVHIILNVKYNKKSLQNLQAELSVLSLVRGPLFVHRLNTSEKPFYQKKKAKVILKLTKTTNSQQFIILKSFSPLVQPWNILLILNIDQYMLIINSLLPTAAGKCPLSFCGNFKSMILKHNEVPSNIKILCSQPQPQQGQIVNYLRFYPLLYNVHSGMSPSLNYQSCHKLVFSQELQTIPL